MAQITAVPVSFGYGAVDGTYYGPKGSIGKYHRGNDRVAPIGTDVTIAGVLIGRTGRTGVVSGAHLHTQAGTDIGCQKDINPTPYEFQPGKVVSVGTGSQWGKFVTMNVRGAYITYCHLNEYFVKVGQVIEAPKPVTPAHPFAYLIGRSIKLTPKNGTWKFYKPNTDTVAVTVKDNNDLVYIVRNVSERRNRVVVNSASGGGLVDVPLANAAGVLYSGEWRVL